VARFTTHLLLQTPAGGNGEYGTSWSSAQWQPRVDIYESAEAIMIQVEVPGLDESNLRLHFEPGHLVVEGRRLRPAPTCEVRALQVEISYGPFRRVLPLPADADGDRIEANYVLGVLQIVVPRRIQREPQNVRINVG